jgi:hypothetical protein
MAGLAGCATEQLAAAPPKGADLSGEWRINLNLSDDPDKPPVDDAAPAGSPQHHRGGAGHGGGNGAPGGGGYGLPGGAGGRSSSPPDDDNFTGATTGGGTASPYVKTLWQGGPGGPAGAGAGGRSSKKSRRAGAGHLLDAPDRMTITQSGGKVTIRSKSASGELLTDEYLSGEKITVPFGDDTAERTAGWRGSIFVVDTKAKKGPEKESDYAIDDDGRLIMATLLTGSHMPKGDIKRVYDRVKAGGPE